MDFNNVQTNLSTAITRLMDKDFYLLKHDVNERSITHKLAEHLQSVFGDSLNVDCEYNRHIKGSIDPKKIYILEVEKERIVDRSYSEASVFPDIIVHKRGENIHNTLVIEVKKSTSTVDRNYDFKKLECYTESNSGINKLQYKYGVFILFYTREDCGNEPEIIWFKDGKKYFSGEMELKAKK